MYWGHVVIEGYCDLSEECADTDNLPCSAYSIGKVAHYCLDVAGDSDESPKKCVHFGWCKAVDCTVATDSNGIEKRCID